MPVTNGMSVTSSATHDTSSVIFSEKETSRKYPIRAEMTMNLDSYNTEEGKESLGAIAESFFSGTAPPTVWMSSPNGTVVQVTDNTYGTKNVVVRSQSVTDGELGPLYAGESLCNSIMGTGNIVSGTLNEVVNGTRSISNHTVHTIDGTKHSTVIADMGEPVQLHVSGSSYNEVLFSSTSVPLSGTAILRRTYGWVEFKSSTVAGTGGAKGFWSSLGKVLSVTIKLATLAIPFVAALAYSQEEHNLISEHREHLSSFLKKRQPKQSIKVGKKKNKSKSKRLASKAPRQK